jgi:preprotein translocase subunit SecG
VKVEMMAVILVVVLVVVVHGGGGGGGGSGGGDAYKKAFVGNLCLPSYGIPSSSRRS